MKFSNIRVLEISKGFYKDNYKNRKLGRVGMHYGKTQDLKTQVDNLYLKIPKIKYTFENKMSIFKKDNVIVSPTNIKTKERVIEKALNEYNGNVNKVKDIVRNTIILLDNKDKENIIQKLQDNFDVDSVKEQTKDKYLGYSGTIINVRINGKLIAEIQLNTPQMIFAKHDTDAETILGKDLYNKIKEKSPFEGGLGHKYYEEFRTSKDIAKKAEIKKKSEEYYSKIRNIKL